MQDWQPYTVDPYSAVCDNHYYTTVVPSVVKTMFRNRARPTTYMAAAKQVQDSPSKDVGEELESATPSTPKNVSSILLFVESVIRM